MTAQGAGSAGSGSGGSAPRILFVSSHAKLGGSELVLEQLVGRLPGEQVVEVVLLEEGPLAARLRERGVRVVLLPTSGRRTDVLRTAWRLSRRVRTVRPDVVHANGVKAAVVCLAAGRRTPVVWMKHDISYDGPVGRFVARRCATVVAVSREVLRGIEGAGSARVVHPGVTVDAARSRAEGAALRSALGLVGPVVTVLGRLDEAKGHAELLEVLPSLVQRLPRVTALLVGGDDPHTPGQRERLAARAAELGVSDHVRLPGHLPVEAVLGASDAVCVPTVPGPAGQGREGFGLVAAEALTAGVPVVAYAVGATPEVLAGCGVLVEPGDRAALARALQRVLEQPSYAQALATGGQQRAQAFTTARMVERLSAVYREVLA